MSNPYHDAEGKFCSRSESLAAVARLFASGNTLDANLLAEEVRKADEIRQFRGLSETTKDLLKYADQVVVVYPSRVDDRVAALDGYTAENLNEAYKAAESRSRAVFEDWKDAREQVAVFDKTVAADTGGVYQDWNHLNSEHNRLRSSAHQQLEDLYQTLLQNGVKDYEAEEAVYKWAAKEVGVHTSDDEDTRVTPITKDLLDGTSLVNRKPAVREILESFIDEPNVQAYNTATENFKPYYRVYRKHVLGYRAAKRIEDDASTKYDQVRQGSVMFKAASDVQTLRKKAGVPETAKMKRLSELDLSHLPENSAGELADVWAFQSFDSLERVVKDPETDKWVLGASTGARYYLQNGEREPGRMTTVQRYLIF